MADKRMLLGLAVLGIAGCFAAFLASQGESSAPAPIATPDAARDPELAQVDAAPPAPIAYPAAAQVEFGVLTDKPEAELAALANAHAAVGLLETKYCGEPATCEVIRGYALDEGHLGVEVMPPSSWILPSDLEKAAPALDKAERAALSTMRVVAVRANGPAFPEQLPARTGFAIAAAIAEKLRGFVYDQKIGRIERAHAFAARAITRGLDEPAFGRERVEVQTSARPDGTLRLVTAGMIRFGAPDLEMTSVDPKSAATLAEILYALADAVAEGDATSPLSITLGDIERVRGVAFSDDAGLPDPVPIGIGLEKAQPEDWDPNMFMLRVVPPDGATKEGYAELAKLFFGAADRALEPAGDSLKITRERAQAGLEKALLALRGDKDAVMDVLVPFFSRGDGGDEYDLWIKVTSFDARTLTGTVESEDGIAIGVKKGTKVTRPRADVIDYQLLLGDGGMVSTRWQQ